MTLSTELCFWHRCVDNDRHVAVARPSSSTYLCAEHSFVTLDGLRPTTAGRRATSDYVRSSGSASEGGGPNSGNAAGAFFCKRSTSVSA